MSTTRRMELMFSLLAFIPLLASPMQAQVTVEGQVAAVDGAPLKADLTLIRSGSTVEFHHYHTDDQGAFSIQTDQSAGQLLVAKADGHTSSEVLLKAESNTKISVPFTLWPAGTVTGRVVDEEGNGVGGATLYVHYSNERRRHFLHHEMGDIHADDFGYFIPARHGARQGFRCRGCLGRPPSRFDRHPEARGRKTGRSSHYGEIAIRSAWYGYGFCGKPAQRGCRPHAPVPGDEIAVAAQFSRLHGRLLNRRTFTDKDGAYEFKGLPSGRVVVIALVPGKTLVKQEKTLPEQGLPGDAYMVNLVVD